MLTRVASAGCRLRRLKSSLCFGSNSACKAGCAGRRRQSGYRRRRVRETDKKRGGEEIAHPAAPCGHYLATCCILRAPVSGRLRIRLVREAKVVRKSHYSVQWPALHLVAAAGCNVSRSLQAVAAARPKLAPTAGVG